MKVMLKRENITFERDAKGELLPVEAPVPALDTTIRFRPMARGDVLQATKLLREGQDAYEGIIGKHLVDPALSEADLKGLKWRESEAIGQTILAISMGLDTKALASKPKDDPVDDLEKAGRDDQKKRQASSSSSTTTATTTTQSTG